MRTKWDVIVIGLGPAGLNAARRLSGLGLDILLLDENRSSGGQYLRRAAAAHGRKRGRPLDALKAEGLKIIEACRQSRLTFRTGVQVMGAESDGRIWGVDQGGRLMEEEARYIVLAPGAREKFLPFPGWTRPGVISCGAAQIMIKTSGVLPGRKCLVGGAGPLPLTLAGEITSAGGRVEAFWDQASRMKIGFRGVRLLPHHTSKIIEGILTLARLILARTSILHGRKVLEVRGDPETQKVALTRMDGRGRAVPGSETAHDVDCLAVGYGFTPNLELAMAAGCGLVYARDRGGWVVDVDETLQTSRSCFFAAGEITGVAGARKSFIEGSMAGLSVAFRLGHLNETAYKAEMNALAERRKAEMTFGAFLNELTRMPPGLMDEVPDETIICRCEDITLGEIRRRIQDGFTSPDALKKSASCGMGPCQGRTCGPIIMDILEAGAGVQMETLPPLSVRTPVKPLPLSALAARAEKETSSEWRNHV